MSGALFRAQSRRTGGAVIAVPLPVGMVVAALAGTASATMIAVVTSWIFLVMVWDPHVLPLLLQRGLPIAVAALLTLLTWGRLGEPERNLEWGAT